MIMMMIQGEKKSYDHRAYALLYKQHRYIKHPGVLAAAFFLNYYVLSRLVFIFHEGGMETFVNSKSISTLAFGFT